MFRKIGLVSAFLSLGISPMALASANSGAGASEPVSVGSEEGQPNTIVVKVEVRAAGESNAKIFLINSKAKITNGDEAEALNLEAEKTQAIPLVENQVASECPESMLDMMKMMGTMHIPEDQSSWSFGVRSPFGNTGFYYGSGRGHNYGYNPGSYSYWYPSYGYYSGNSYWPYYGANYYHRNGNHRYYYYHSPYHRW